MSTSRAFRRFCFAFLVWLVPLATPATADDVVDIPIPQARQLAVQAMGSGQPQLAMDIALGLLKRDPKDAFAYFVIANAQKALGNPGLGRTAAALAFRNANSDTEKFESAQLAARLSFETKQLTQAQIWLRRSAPYAPSPAHVTVIRRDYGVLRALNPWNFQFRLAFAPSSNVNNGSDSPYNIIDGVPVIGILGGSALALPGTTGLADIGVSYRLGRSKTNETTLAGRLIVQRVWLGTEARAIAPTVRNGDFSSTTAEATLRHGFRPAGTQARYTVGFGLGRSWYGGKHLHDFAKLNLAYGRALDQQTTLSLSAEVEHRDALRGPAFDSSLFTLRTSLSRRLGNGDTAGLHLAYNLNEAPLVNAQFTRTIGYVSYDFEQPVGPAKLSLLAGASVLDYPAYNVGIIRVPGGRQDKSAFVSANATFETLGYAGFSPQLSLRASRTRSNVSRFTTSELSLTFGIASSF